MLTDAERDELLAVMTPAQWLQLARACRQVQTGGGFGTVSVEFRRGLPRHVVTTTSAEMVAPPAGSAPATPGLGLPPALAGGHV